MRLAAALALVLPSLASAQYFDYQEFGDVLLTFRKTGQAQGNDELVVKLGYITNFLELAAGATIHISNYSPTQLSDAFPDDYANLQWEVCSAFMTGPAMGTKFGPWLFPDATIWYTRPATNATTQSPPPPRMLLGLCQDLRQRMLSMGDGAAFISNDLVQTNQDNNTSLVVEPITYDQNDVTYNIGDRVNPALGDFYGMAFQYSVENKTPAPFAGSSRTDLYQMCPTSDSLNTYTDPITGKTNGNGYFVGYFLLQQDGTMSFTRASTNSVPPSPPPAPKLLIGTSSTTTTVSFGTTNGATYILHYTNGAGLNAPISSWPSLPGTITGDGTVKSFSDSTTDAQRFYRVGAH